MGVESGLKKRRGGWIEVEEPTAIESTASEAPPVADTSANEAPKTLSISFEGLREAFSATIGAPTWHQFGAGQIDLTAKQRISVLEAVLEDRPLTIPSVESLIAELRKPNENGWTLAGSFSALVRIATEWLALHGARVEPPKLDDAAQHLRDRLTRSWEEGKALQAGKI